MTTTVFIDRAHLGVDLLRNYGPEADADYDKLLHVLRVEDADVHIWGTYMPPGLITRLAGMGFTVHDIPRKPASGLVEAEMTVAALTLPDETEELVLVGGSGALVPMAEALLRAGVRVRVAGFKDSTSGRLVDLPGITIQRLDGADLLLERAAALSR